MSTVAAMSPKVCLPYALCHQRVCLAEQREWICANPLNETTSPAICIKQLRYRGQATLSSDFSVPVTQICFEMYCTVTGGHNINTSALRKNEND